MKIRILVFIFSFLLSSLICAQNFVIEPSLKPDNYIGLPFDEEGHAVVKKLGLNLKIAYHLIDRQGNILKTYEDFEIIKKFNEGLALAKKDNKWGFIDKSGAFVIPPVYIFEPGEFSEGLALVSIDGKNGYIDRKGEIVIPPTFKGGYSRTRTDKFSEGLAAAQLKDKWGFIDKTGNFVIPPQYSIVEDFSDGLAFVYNKKTGGYFIDKNGNKILETKKHLEEDIFSEGLSVFKEYDGKSFRYGYIDKNNNVVIEPQFIAARNFSNGYAVVAVENHNVPLKQLYGIINKQGEFVFPPKYYSIQDVSGNMAAYQEDAWNDKFGYLRFYDLSSLENFLKENLSEPENIISLSDYVKPKVESEINSWQKRGEFETTEAWGKRVNDDTRQKKIDELSEKFKTEYKNYLEKEKKSYQAQYDALVKSYYDKKIELKKKGYDSKNLELSDYDPDNQSFLISSNGKFPDILLPVSITDAPTFKDHWHYIKYSGKLEYTPVGDDVVLTAVEFEDGKKKFRYDGSSEVSYALAKTDYNFNPLELTLNDEEIEYNFDSVETIAANVVKTKGKERGTSGQDQKPVMLSDVDQNIPEITPGSNPNTFAVIIGNENYQKVSPVSFAKNDAERLAEYCEKTLGLPSKNIRLYTDATYAQFMSAVEDIKNIAQAYNGDIDVIFYYAGHGIPNESNHSAYLLPVDADGRQIKVCYPLEQLFSELGEMGTKSVKVFMDACFSGSQRGDGMLASARGVALKAKASEPKGNMVVFTAASGDETAYPYNEKGHGLFTYYLLKKLQETKGDVKLGDLGSYIYDKVSKESVVTNGKSQTPTVRPSLNLTETWQSLSLK